MHKLTLIDGEFSHSEANEILMNLLTDKIQFHEMNNFSSMERFGQNNKIAQKRIPELKKSLVQLKEIIANAKDANKRLVINSIIEIQYLESD